MPAKRIIIITNRVPYPLNDGGNMATNAMIYGYKQNGWDVLLLSMNTSRHKISDKVLEEIYQDIHCFKTVDVNNDIKLLPTLANYLFSNQPNHVDRFKSATFEHELKVALVEFRPSVVQIESIYLTQYLETIKENAGVATVLRLHNVEYQIWDRLANSANGLFKTKYLKDLTSRIASYERNAWQEYDLLLPITETDKEMAGHDVEKAHMLTVPYGIYSETIIKSSGEDWVGYHIGAMDWLPNKEGVEWFLTDVFPEIRRNIPAFEFYFAGRNMPASIEGDGQNGVYNCNEVESADEFISDKKILIVPLKSGGGIRVKILEAMAAGKIVVSTDVGMQGIDAIPDTHYLKANTPADFLSAISWLLSNKKEADGISVAAQKLIADKYDQVKIAQNLSKKLETLIVNQES